MDGSNGTVVPFLDRRLALDAPEEFVIPRMRGDMGTLVLKLYRKQVVLEVPGDLPVPGHGTVRVHLILHSIGIPEEMRDVVRANPIVFAARMIAELAIEMNQAEINVLVAADTKAKKGRGL